MGNRVINPDKIGTHADSMIRVIHNVDESLNNLQSSIKKIDVEEGLSGTGWKSVKYHMRAYDAVIEGIDALTDVVTGDCIILKNSVGDEILREAEIEKDILQQEKTITSCEDRINHYCNIMNTCPELYLPCTQGINRNRNIIDSANKAKARLEAKIKEIDTIEKNTNGLFDPEGGLISAIRAGLRAIAASSRNGFTMPKDPDWIKALETAIGEQRKKTLDASMGDDDIAKAYSKDPVCLSTGNFIYGNDDLQTGGNDIFSFSRFYNSMSSERGTLGRGWVHNFEVELKTVKDNGRKLIEIRRENGSAERFADLGSGKYVQISGSRGNLTFQNNEYIYSSEESVKLYFDADGRYIRRTGKHGSTIKLSYEGDRLKSAEKESGEAYYFTYSEGGRLLSVKDSSGRKTEYSYEDDRLIKVSAGGGKCYRYEYDRNGYLSAVIDPAGETAVMNTFDEQGRNIKQSFPDGTDMTYEYHDNEKFVVQKERNGSVSRHFRDSRFRTTRNEYADGCEEYKYNDRNQRISQKDKNGNVTEFEYDRNGNVTKVVNAEGTVTAIEYNEDKLPLCLTIDGKRKIRNEYFNGRLKSRTDGIGRKTMFLYGSGNEPEQLVKGDSSIVFFEYDSRGNIISITNESGSKTQYRRDELNRISTLISPNGNIRQITYDENDNITSLKLPDNTDVKYITDSSGRLLREEINGRTVNAYEYNSIGQVSKKTDASGRTTEYRYDKMWNIAEMVMPNGGIIKYTYNENNRVDSMTDAEGGTLKFSYDGEGNLLSLTDQNGCLTEYEYNKVNKLTCVRYADKTQEHFDYDGAGNIIRYTDKAGNEHQFFYDAADQLIRETDPLGNSREYTYTDIGRIKTTTDEAGNVTEYSYYPGGTLKQISYPDGASEKFKVDIEGNVTEYIDPTGCSRKYTFDCMNRLISVEGENGGKTLFTYDRFGNMASKTDPDGNIITYDYSPTGEIIKVTDELGNETEFDYDMMDELIEVRRYSENRSEVQTTKYVRDLMGRITETVDPLGNREIIKYDANGRVCEKTDRDGYSTRFRYTCHSKLAEIEYEDGRSAKYKYDPLGRMQAIEDWNGVTTIDRDPMGRPVKVRYPAGDMISYTYGKTGERRSLTYPDGKTVFYDYDDQMRLSGIRKGNAAILHEYNEFGKISRKHFSNGTDVSYEYAKTGMLTSLTYSDDLGTIDKFLYGYDRKNNIISIEKTRRGLTDDSGKYEFEYDSANRLVKVTKDGSEIHAYSYDAFGNRTEFSSKAGEEYKVSYEYNRANQLISERKGDSLCEYSYDKRGNLIEKKTDGNLSLTFSYGVFNRLSETADASTGECCEYLYNGLGCRIGERSATGETAYITDITQKHSNLINVRQNSSSRNVIWDGNGPAIVTGDKDSFCLNDHLGSPARITDENHKITESFGYDEFGLDASFNPAESIQPFGFTGYMKDRISDSYFAQARQYMPGAGRFAEEDIVGSLIDDPRSFNRYSYCLSSPVSLVDRTGAFPTPAEVVNNMKESIPDVLNWAAENAMNLRVQEPLKIARDITERTPFSNAAAYASNTKLGERTIDLTLNMDRDNTGVYHTRQDCWQKYAGYNDFYDKVFKNFTSAGRKKLPFNCNGKEYTLWMWKGDYFGLGGGAEAGIYSGSGAHRYCYTDSKLKMKLSLYNKAGYQVFKYEPKEDYWWITGFNPDWQDVDYEELTSFGMVDFSQYDVNGRNDMWEGFLKRYGNPEAIKRYSLCIDRKNQIVYFRWRGE